MYRSLAEAYGWPPEVVNRMTIAQLSIFTCKRAEDARDATPKRYRGRDIVTCSSTEEAQALIAKGKANKNA